MSETEITDQQKRSRRRLIGAVALAVIAAIVLPLVMDEKPPLKPAEDLKITLPQAGESQPLNNPTPQRRLQPDLETEHWDHLMAPPEGSGDDGVVVPPPDLPDVPVPSLPATPARPPQVETPPVAVAPATPQPPPVPSGNREAERVKAILEGRKADVTSVTSQAPASASRPAAAKHYVVQVAAFSSAEKAEAMKKTLKAKGFDAFTEKAGRVVRVRVGPFKTRAQADKTAAGLRLLNMSAVIATQ